MTEKPGGIAAGQALGNATPVFDPEVRHLWCVAQPVVTQAAQQLRQFTTKCAQLQQPSFVAAVDLFWRQAVHAVAKQTVADSLGHIGPYGQAGELPKTIKTHIHLVCRNAFH